jgi:hypothetical protein
MLEEEGEKESLVCVPGHKGIIENEMADIEAITALEDDIHPTTTYPPQDLAKWLNTKAIESRNLKWKESNNEMKEKKSKTEDRTNSLSLLVISLRSAITVEHTLDM